MWAFLDLGLSEARRITLNASSTFWWPDHRNGGRKLWSLPACLHTHWKVHLPCCCRSSPTLEPTSSGSEHRLKTSSNPPGLHHQTGIVGGLNSQILGPSSTRQPLQNYTDHILKATVLRMRVVEQVNEDRQGGRENSRESQAVSTEQRPLSIQ